MGAAFLGVVVQSIDHVFGGRRDPLLAAFRHASVPERICLNFQELAERIICHPQQLGESVLIPGRREVGEEEAGLDVLFGEEEEGGVGD